MIDSERNEKATHKQSGTKKQKEIKHQNIKDDSQKEELRFLINKVDKRKFIKKVPKVIKQVKQIIDDDIAEEEEIIQDEFLNINEFSEIKGNYDDYGLGDLAVVFPNPDHPNIANKSVTFRDAEKLYDEVLTVMTNEGVSKSQMKSERNSFLYAFLTLDDYVAEKSVIDKLKNKDFKKAKSPVKVNLESQRSEELKQEVNKKKKKKDLSSYNRYLITKKTMKQDTAHQVLHEQKQMIYDLHSDPDEQKLIENDVKEAEQHKDQYLDPIKELLKIDLTDLKQFKKVKKSYSKGKYLQLKKISENSNDTQWMCSNSQPKDYLTLVRFTVMSKLSRHGCLHTRTFISSDGSDLFMVLKSNKAVIRRQAESAKMTKQLELGYADLFSLEPCDKKFRPLRLKNYIRDYQTNDKVKELLEKIQLDEDEQTRLRQQSTEKQTDGINIPIEEKAQQMYHKVKLWDDLELRVNIIRKQIIVDKYMKVMAKYLNFDMVQEKEELIHDADYSRKQWEPYYIYLMFITEFMSRMEKVDTHSEVKYNQAFLYKLIFRKAVCDSNDYCIQLNSSVFGSLFGDDYILKTLWDRLGVPPISPYAGYFNPNNDSSSSMWRKSEVNEKGLRSEFNNIEKIKITHIIVLKNINIMKLKQLKMVNAYYPIHDPYQLNGISKIQVFSPLLDGGLMYHHVLTAGDMHLKKLFSELQDEAEATDFDVESLDEQSQFNYKIPWMIPIDSIRDYFGEKIALYFDFLTFYTKQLWYMGILGVVAQGLISAKSDGQKTWITIFSIVIIIWSTFFIKFWRREQMLFSVQFGQQNFEEDEAGRPAFIGRYIRSITSDNLNEEYYSPFLRKMKILLSLAISTIIIAMVIGCVFGIFYLKDYFNGLTWSKHQQQVIDQVPSILNSLQILIFNFIYQDLGKRFNDFENHKILSSYENSLIAKVFIFRFVNTFNSFFIIAFLTIGKLDLCKVDVKTSNCFDELQIQMRTIFIITFAKNIPSFLKPFITEIIMRRGIDDKPIVHPFNKIDTIVEEQLQLAAYVTNDEVDGTVGDYMELVVQFSFLCLFGLAFPISFLLAFITNVTVIQGNKRKLLKYSRRPFPQGASNIGNWLIILEVVTFLGIFSNAGLIVYTSQDKGTKPDLKQSQTQIITFSILIIVFLGTKYLIRFIIPDTPASATVLNKRHKYAVDRVFKGFSKSRVKAYKSANVNLNMGGVMYGDGQKMDLNSYRSK